MLSIKWNSDGTVLKKAYNTDAGYDIVYNKRICIPAESGMLIQTDLVIQIPEGYCGIIKARSSTFKKELFIIDGVIDAGYCGPLTIQMYNIGDKDVVIRRNTAVAQILFLPVPEVTLQRVKEFSSSQRGTNGFGSSDNMENT